MTFALLYWILMLIWLVFGLWSNWPAAGPGSSRIRPLGGTVLLFILLVLLGWRVFGQPLHD